MLTVEIDERTVSAVVIASLRRSIRLADEMLAGMDASLADSQALFSDRMALLQVLDFCGPKKQAPVIGAPQGAAPGRFPPG